MPIGFYIYILALLIHIGFYAFALPIPIEFATFSVLHAY